MALLIIAANTSNAQQNKPLPQKTMTAPSATSNNGLMLTPQEKEYATKLLKDTEAGAFNAVKNLSEAQLTFKPTPDKWSVEDCIKHIAAAEKTLWSMVYETLQKPANPEKRADIKFTDQELVNAVEDRSHKSTTFAALEPANQPYKTLAEALTSFKNNREKLIAFMNNAPANLRNHVAVLPIGTYDAYQFILLIAAHSNRHTQQIQEVKANVNYPKL